MTLEMCLWEENGEGNFVIPHHYALLNGVHVPKLDGCWASCAVCCDFPRRASTMIYPRRASRGDHQVYAPPRCSSRKHGDRRYRRRIAVEVEVDALRGTVALAVDGAEVGRVPLAAGWRAGVSVRAEDHSDGAPLEAP